MLLKFITPKVYADLENKSFVYFIQDNNLIKIGYASNLLGRLGHYKTHNPNKLYLKGLCIGSSAEENYLHSMFKDCRIKDTEWFHYSKIIDYLGEYVLNFDLNEINQTFCEKSNDDLCIKQINVKLSQKDFDDIENINRSYYENSFSNSSMVRLLIRKGLETFNK